MKMGKMAKIPVLALETSAAAAAATHAGGLQNPKKQR